MTSLKLFLFVALFSLPHFLFAAVGKDRLVILADMGNEPDEEQQIVHMMMYANEFDLEGLIAVTGKFLRPESPQLYRRFLHPELFFNIIDQYEKVRPNLMLHAEGWPEANYLRSIVVNGQTGYGINDIGKGKSTAGSDLLKKLIRKQDPRPLYVVVNAGSNTLAQALLELENESTAVEFKNYLSRLRVFENGAQDDAGGWINAHYPDIHWIRSNYQTYAYAGPGFDSAKGKSDADIALGPYTWKPYEYSAVGQHQWALKHIKGDHGVLGAAWPIRQTPNGRIVYLEGGGTVPWLGLIHRGLSSIEKPHWGGWSGRFTTEKIKNVRSKHQTVREVEETYGDYYVYTEASDRWVDPDTKKVYDDIYTPVWRWRQAFFNDFQARMDWAVTQFKDANHNPIAAINGDKEEKIYYMNLRPGESLHLDASQSQDPDGDKLSYNWWVYEEVSSYKGKYSLKKPHQPKISFSVPEKASYLPEKKGLGEDIHLILDIIDNSSIVPLSDYRRIVITLTER